MTRPSPLRLLLLLSLVGGIAIFAATAEPTSSSAAVRHDQFPLHRGSSGPRVCDLQWVLGGHRPSAFRNRIKPTYFGTPTCYDGARTAAATLKMKFRLGYPKIYLRPIAGATFFRIITGKQRRPALWVHLSLQRTRLVVAATATKVLTVPKVGAVPLASVAGPALPPGVVLKLGSHGQRVRNLQWLLHGGKPNAFTFAPYFKEQPNGIFGPRTATALVQTKRRLGYPDSALKPIAGREFELILEGREVRPLAWVIRATTRLNAYITAHTPCADRLIAEGNRYIGYHEIPDGSNSGPQVSLFQATTGQYRAAWCASWIQSMLKWSGYGTVAHDSAYVPYIRAYASYHQWLHAVARPGALVIFYYDYHHIGLVTSVTTTGVWVVSGNYGNAVRKTFFRYGSVPLTYVWLPGCTG